MSDKQLFNRDWAVTIGKSGTTGNRYTNLKTTFEIEKTSSSSSNKAKIEIYNLSAASRRSFQKGFQVRLEAGYVGMREMLYIGDIVKAHSKRSGPDIVTTFECGDGEKTLADSHFSKSYGAGTSFSAIIQDIASTLGVPIGQILGIPSDVYNHGLSFSNSARFALDKLCKKANLEWSIQNGVLQILPITKHTGEEAIVVSAKTGLIDVPSQINDGVQFTSLMNTKITPGSLIYLVAEGFTGYYKNRKAKFEGDTHGDKWQIVCEAVPIPATQTVTSVSSKFVSQNIIGLNA